MDFFDSFLLELAKHYPETNGSVNLRERLIPTLFCGEVLELPIEISEQARRICEAFHSLRDLPDRKKQLENIEPKIPDPGNYSALMSYDYHIDESGQLRLIEINTNASMGLITDLLYRMQGVENTFSKDFQNEILETFSEEYRLAQPKGAPLDSALIVDAQPESQRLFVEFLMYRELLRRANVKCEIADPSEVQFESGSLIHKGSRVDLVYNRHTDFYFETEDTSALKAAMLDRAACISPHPHEYRLLADKERMLELSSPGAIEALPLEDKKKEIISKALIRTIDLTSHANPAEIWGQRKRWFFKPKRMFGGKAAYRGASISRSTFERLLNGEFVAQEYVPAPLIKLKSSPDQEFKFDLRFFAYRDKIQLACARIYQGQMTNSQTPGGGIAPIRFI